jgi:hypothetical protein
VGTNPKQVTDIDGSLGYGRLGMCEESADLSLFDSRGVYAWLPSCSYVQIDPVQRLYDTYNRGKSSGSSLKSASSSA